jgi:hypothetical protein
MVKNSLDFMNDKIINDNIIWDKAVKVALAFKLNGRRLIEALPGGIYLPTGQIIALSEANIAADGSGYTN